MKTKVTDLNQTGIRTIDTTGTVFSSDIVSRAREYAIRVHSETNHRYDGKPYEVHLQIVYDFACKYVHLLPSNRIISDVLSACWVHDVIEDCRQTYNDVKSVVGETVADIAYALTNEKGKTRKDRANDKYYDGIRNTPLAAYVKICDRLANAKYSKEIGRKMFEMYRKENAHFRVELWSMAYLEMFDELYNIFHS